MPTNAPPASHRSSRSGQAGRPNAAMTKPTPEVMVTNRVMRGLVNSMYDPKTPAVSLAAESAAINEAFPVTCSAAGTVEGEADIRAPSFS